jgi:hypothetical protein
MHESKRRSIAYQRDGDRGKGGVGTCFAASRERAAGSPCSTAHALASSPARNLPQQENSDGCVHSAI